MNNKYSGILKTVVLLVVALNLSNCAGQKMVRPDTSPASFQQHSQQGIPEYKLGFGDVIEVKFFNNEKFNETVTVRPDGRISLQKVGDILVAGMTPSELDMLITNAYSQIVKRPDVTVIVRQFGGYQVFVLGEVNKPGGFPLQQNMTILQAIAMAGGKKDTAKMGSVMILRRDENGELTAVKVNLADVVKGKSTENIPVHAQDIVYVPKTFVANVSTFINQVFDGALPPLNAYLQVLFWTRTTRH